MLDDETELFQKRLGTVIAGRWTLERLLGAGGMAAVYAARHRIGRCDAIKILHPEYANHSVLRARFEREAHAVNSFRHPGAVEIHDIDALEDGTPYLVMELLEGESLATRLDRLHFLPQDEVLLLVDQLLDVLVAAHGVGIIHRDIKPDNLFLLTNGRLKVLDFGIARVREGPQAKALTRAGATLGTPNYMPPEQIKGIDVDHRSDLFAVGAVMFTLLSGHWIHDAATDQELLVKMLTLPAPPLSKLLPQAPTGLCQVVDRALSFEQADRYPDALTMQLDVRALREGREPPYASKPQPPRPVKTTPIPVTVASSPTPVIPTLVSQAVPVVTPAAVVTPSAAVTQPAAASPLTAVVDLYRRVPRSALIAAASLALGVLATLVIVECASDPDNDDRRNEKPAASSRPTKPDKSDRQQDLEQQWRDLEKRK
jgi:serine/threonine-protein kinase